MTRKTKHSSLLALLLVFATLFSLNLGAIVHADQVSVNVQFVGSAGVDENDVPTYKVTMEVDQACELKYSFEEGWEVRDISLVGSEFSESAFRTVKLGGPAKLEFTIAGNYDTISGAAYADTDMSEYINEYQLSNIPGSQQFSFASDKTSAPELEDPEEPDPVEEDEAALKAQKAALEAQEKFAQMEKEKKEAEAKQTKPSESETEPTIKPTETSTEPTETEGKPTTSALDDNNNAMLSVSVICLASGLALAFVALRKKIFN